jgi:hypothetical protein
VGLTIITNTAGNRPRQLEQCCDAVSDMLPPGANHKVIHANDFHAMRWAALDVDDVVAWVDDDDLVTGDSIRRCWDAMQHTGAGLVFTWEQIVPGRSQRYNVLTHTRQIIEHPRAAHHLAMFRTAGVRPECRTLTEKYGVGLEWFMKASAACSHAGAVQLPYIGYIWRDHGKNYSRQQRYNAQYASKRIAMSREMDAWCDPSTRLIDYPLEGSTLENPRV